MDNIFISIIIPTFNRPQYLKQALMSAVTQTYKKIEVVIVNDGEKDEMHYPDKIYDIPIRLYHPKRHFGGATSRNYGVSKAHYDWIAFLDDDDIWAPNKLEKQVGIIKENPQIQFVYHDHYIFDSEYRVYDRKQLSHHYSRDHKHFLKNLMIYSATGSTSSFLIKKSNFENVNGFNDKMPSAQDHDLALRLFKSGVNFYCIPEPLLFYREHLNKISMNLENKLEGRIKIIQTKKNLFPQTYKKYESEIQFLNHYAIAFVFLFNRKGKLALKHAISTFQLKKRIIIFIKLFILINLSTLNLLNLVRQFFSIFKQIKYHTISHQFRNLIKSNRFSSIN